ncbi:MAG: 23S rRNA (pseudouridine(1915)-N(3))-methyltransferase RlmH [Bacteroidota bacterium]
MTIRLIYIGKTFQPFIAEGCQEFEKRLKKYIKLEVIILPDVKQQGSMEPAQLKKHEAQLVLKQLKSEDFLVLLDERGGQLSSVDFSKNLQEKMNRGTKTLCFLVGGAFGFDEQLYQRANEKLSFSKMTFSHQMIRLFLTEQIYRAFSILKNEPYHNE